MENGSSLQSVDDIVRSYRRRTCARGTEDSDAEENAQKLEVALMRLQELEVTMPMAMQVALAGVYAHFSCLRSKPPTQSAFAAQPERWQKHLIDIAVVLPAMWLMEQPGWVIESMDETKKMLVDHFRAFLALEREATV